MYNYFMLVGRITHNPEIKNFENNRKVMTLSLAVQRPFKNQYGAYDTDFIKVSFWDVLAETFASHAYKGQMVGVKGRISVSNNQMALIGEKILFLEKKA